MLEMQVSRTVAQKIYTVIHNVDADSITAGMVSRYVGGAVGEVASADGIGAVKISANADFINLAGVAKKDIPSDGYGIVQNWGYVDSVLVSAIAANSVTPGIMLGASAVAGATEGVTGVTDQALSTMAYNYIEAWVTTGAQSGLPYTSGFIRAI